MGCTVTFEDPFVCFDFCANPHRQKVWIDVLIQYTNIDISTLASILQIPTDILSEVHKNNTLLTKDQAETLAALFLTFFAG